MSHIIIRFLKAIWYTITFRAHEKADRIIMQHPMAVHAMYEDIISEKQENLIMYKKGIEQLTNLIELKRNSADGFTTDINNIKKLKERAFSEQNNIITDLQKAGTSTEEIEHHPSYLRCNTVNNNYHSMLEKKHTHLDKLKQDIEQGQKDIESQSQHLIHLQNELEIIKKEQSEMVTELIREREQEKIINALK